MFHMSTSCLNTGLQLSISLPPEDEPEFLACCILSEKPVTIQFQRVSTSITGDEYTNNFKWPTSINPVDLNNVSVEAKQLVHLYLSNEQDLLNSGACGQQG
jgi:hypothetical protein